MLTFVGLGIDYLHPAFGGGFGKGFKVSNGYDLVGDKYTGSNTPVPDSDPLDACTAASGASGHGTHVSGIIAGYDAATVSYIKKSKMIGNLAIIIELYWCCP